jgi:hypothetical protein
MNAMVAQAFIHPSNTLYKHTNSIRTTIMATQTELFPSATTALIASMMTTA